ncbi:MAG: nucleotidyltransferase domain-containing protein [Blautia sp.]|nr:nucleotidyltransferase domain-containing protein [Blautia sp.]
MYALEKRNGRIIEAILEKEKKLCPGTIALIGIYGSFLTGDIHPLSDLDLLILINDDRGWQLGTAFIQEDQGVAHDIYCTSWESLRQDACFTHPHISKLMDSRIVYCADEKYRSELEKLREQVRNKMTEPFGEEDYRKAENELKEAQCCYAKAMIATDLDHVRRQAGGAVYYVENAIALLNKTYFRKGVKRRYEELNDMERKPVKLCEMIDDILTAETVACIKDRLTLLMQELDSCFQKVKQSIQIKKKPASAEILSGTYEEMFSNWHGKIVLAAENDDCHLAFMSLESLNEMLDDIAREVDIRPYNVLSAYIPGNLQKTAEKAETILQSYLQEYKRVGLKEKRCADIESFIEVYLESAKHDLNM